MTIEAVFFDVGETLVDETPSWEEWADWLGLPHFTFMAVLGGVIARGQHHTRVFELLFTGFDLDEQRAARKAAGKPETVRRDDLYPDALPCLAALKAAGYIVGLAANQTA
jgi:FMN phosphatase YigB (HAD superfamily)